MTKRPDYYKILHVDPDAPEEIIRVSYRTLMQTLRMHPDLGGDHEHATLINEAFRVLGDPVHRDRYDEARRRAGAAADEPAPPEPAVTLDEGAAVSDARKPVTQPACPFCRGRHDIAQLNTPDAMCEACGAPLFAAALHQPDGDARRAVDRLPRNSRVSFRRAGDDQVVRRGASQDVSLNGMRFLTHTFLEAEERLIVACDFCIAVGIVRNVRRHEVDQAGWECGVEFITLRIRRQRGALISTVA